MALPKTKNLNLYRGDRFQEDIPILSDDGTARDLTNLEVSAQIRDRQGGDLILEFNTEKLLPETDGIVRLTLTKAEAEQLSDRAYWDLQVTDPQGEPETEYAGTVRGYGEVTTP